MFETLCDKYGMIPQVFEVGANGKILYEEEINKIAEQHTRRESTQEWIDRTNKEWEESKKKDEKV